MPSFQVGDVCYSTQLDAVKAMAAREVGKLTQIGTASYVVDVSATSATSITYILRNVASTATVTKVAPVAVQPCGLLETGDALLISWGIAAVWIGTHAVLSLRKGLQE